MDKAALERILRLYGLDASEVRPGQKGYRNTSYPIMLKDGRIVNFILYKVEPGILNRIRLANEVGDFLHTSGLPARRTYDQRIVKLNQGQTMAYGALYEYLPGQTIPWEAYTKAHIKLVGMAMATVHTRLKQLDIAAPRVTDEYKDILTRMEEYFARPGVTAAMEEKLKLQVPQTVCRRLAGMLTVCDTLPGQLLHMDFVRGNLLFRVPTPDDTLVVDEVALSGIIDFEKVAYGHPLFDVARTLAFLLVDCKYRSPEKVRKYFLYSGYQKYGGGPSPALILKNGHRKLALLDELTDLFLLYDFYKFLRHNPYESLHENEHFVRTRDILIERKMVHCI